MKKTYDDDDGRTIADMSGVGRDNLIIPRLPPSKEERLKEGRERSDADTGREDSRPDIELNSDERKSYIFGAMSAGLLIALIFIAAFALLIVILLLIWKH